jgi:hypothetical protein
MAGLILAWATGSAALLMVKQYRDRPEAARSWERRREAVARELRAKPGPHLVIVGYGDRHNVNEEWVYNEADLHRARVIWARSMGPTRDAALIRYFPDRKAWRIWVDSGAPGRHQLMPVPPI